jgi:methyl-accepting chemotaxis protein
MSAIADFKKRRQAQRALQNNVAETEKKVDAEKATENEALTLLAELLRCDVQEALEKGREAISDGFYVVKMNIDLASGDDKTVTAEVQTSATGEIEKITVAEPQNDTVTADLERAASDLESSASTVEGAADTVTGAAEQISSTAGDLEDTASQLAYSAEDIGQVTAELKEATAELKKPSAEPKSSPGGKAAPRKSNSKKSG